MAERINLEAEVKEILLHIDNGDNFLLSGGAGSGKTYSLEHLIRQLFIKQPTAKIACMTYTNSAVKEIESRVNHKNLTVSTIHDFLWDNIKSFQKELKISLINLINDDESNVKNPEESPIPNDYFDGVWKIEYKEHLKIKEGEISHDEVLLVASEMFKNNPKLCNILKDKFEFIFIDEYQDTSKEVVEILLTHLKQGDRKNIIGFFGDSMQSIYDHGVGDLNNYRADFNEVLKPNNWRNPEPVINLANLLRTDSIKQESSHTPPKTGTAKFYHSDNNDTDFIKEKIGWDFEDTKETKILNLTQNLIAKKAGFENLMEIYNRDRIIEFKKNLKEYIKENNISTNFSENTFGEVIEQLDFFPRGGVIQNFINENTDLYNFAKNQNYELFSKIYLGSEQLIDDKKQNKDEESKKGSKRCDLIKHLFKIQNNISLYKNRDYNEFIRKTDYQIDSIEDKRALKNQIEELSEVEEKTIKEIIEKADEYGICKKDDKINTFIEEKEYVFNRVKQIKFSEFQNLYNYLEGYTPFSTQHKTKGSEFDNVLVILDNGRWWNYNFKKLFIGGNSESVESRTQKIFYVCCTRAKENLAVFFHNPSTAVIEKAEEWFGEHNVIKI